MFFDRFEALCKAKGISCKKAALEIGFSNSLQTRWRAPMCPAFFREARRRPVPRRVSVTHIKNCSVGKSDSATSQRRETHERIAGIQK